MALSWFKRDWRDRETELKGAVRGEAEELMNTTCYPAVVVQQTSGDYRVEENFMGSDDVIEILSLLHFVPQLIPGALQHLQTHTPPANSHCALSGAAGENFWNTRLLLIL